MKNLIFKNNYQLGTSLSIMLISMIVVSCELDEVPRLFPEPFLQLKINTYTAEAITTSSAMCGGIIISDGGASKLTKGVCWSTSPAPTIADHANEDILNADTIKVTLNGLMMYTTYYVRPFAMNSLDIIYGEETTFTTQGGTVTDIDGNVYATISIGSQVWMAENLTVTKYLNGDSIALVMDPLVWQTSPGAYCYYKNDINNKEVYGGLYNWLAVNDSRQLAPEGWHVPTDTEWALLSSAAGSGGNLKEKNMSHWKSPNVGATNESGFTGLPGGYRDRLGTYLDIQKKGSYWSSTPFIDEWGNSGAWYSYLSYDSNNAEVWRILASHGYSVRCVRD